MPRLSTDHLRPTPGAQTSRLSTAGSSEYAAAASQSGAMTDRQPSIRLGSLESRGSGTDSESGERLKAWGTTNTKRAQGTHLAFNPPLAIPSHGRVPKALKSSPRDSSPTRSKKEPKMTKQSTGWRKGGPGKPNQRKVNDSAAWVQSWGDAFHQVPRPPSTSRPRLTTAEHAARVITEIQAIHKEVYGDRPSAERKGLIGKLRTPVTIYRPNKGLPQLVSGTDYTLNERVDLISQPAASDAEAGGATEPRRTNDTSAGLAQGELESAGESLRVESSTVEMESDLQRMPSVGAHNLVVGQMVFGFARNTWKPAQVQKLAVDAARLHFVGKSTAFDLWVPYSDIQPTTLSDTNTYVSAFQGSRHVDSVEAEQRKQRAEIKHLMQAQQAEVDKIAADVQEDVKHSAQSHDTPGLANAVGACAVIQDTADAANAAGVAEKDHTARSTGSPSPAEFPGAKDRRSKSRGKSGAGREKFQQEKPDRSNKPLRIVSTTNSGSSTWETSSSFTNSTFSPRKREAGLSLLSGMQPSVRKFLLEMASTASALASSLLYCSKCQSPNVCLDAGQLVCRTCFVDVELPTPLLDEKPLVEGWDKMTAAQKMAVLMRQAESISARVGHLATIYHEPTSNLAHRMTQLQHAAEYGGGGMFGAAYQTLTPEERALLYCREEEPRQEDATSRSLGESAGEGARLKGADGRLPEILGSPPDRQAAQDSSRPGSAQSVPPRTGDSRTSAVTSFTGGEEGGSDRVQAAPSARALGLVGYQFDTVSEAPSRNSSSYASFGPTPQIHSLHHGIGTGEDGAGVGRGPSTSSGTGSGVTASVSEVRAGVQAEHPSVVHLNRGPADPRDLEASVSQFRALLKAVEQVRHYEHLVHTMQRDHDDLVAKHAAEAAQIRETQSKYANYQIEMSERQKNRAVRNSKAREIARCMRIGQLERQLRVMRGFADKAQEDRDYADAKLEEMESLRAQLAKKNEMLGHAAEALDNAMRQKHEAEEAAQYAREASHVKAKLMKEDAARQRLDEQERHKGMEEAALKLKVQSVQKVEKERRKMLIETLVGAGGAGAGGASYPPTNVQKQRHELLETHMDKMRQAFVKLLSAIGKQHGKGNLALTATIATATDRIEELIKVQTKGILEKMLLVDRLGLPAPVDIDSMPPAPQMASHGCQTDVIGQVEGDLRKYYPEEKKSQKGAKKRPGAPSASEHTRTGKMQEDKGAGARLGELRSMVDHVLDLKRGEDKMRRRRGAEALALRDFVADVLLAKSWVPLPGDSAMQSFLFQVYQCRDKDETVGLMARFLLLTSTPTNPILPRAFMEAYLDAHHHKTAFIAVLAAARTYYRPDPSGIGDKGARKKERVVPLATATLLSRDLIDQLKLHAWTNEAATSFETDSTAKRIIPASDIHAVEHITTHVGTVVQAPAAGKATSQDVATASKDGVVCVSQCFEPVLEAWKMLWAEWQERYQAFVQLHPSKVQGAAASAPASLGHYADAMQAILPAEVWQVISKHEVGAANYYRLASEKEAFCQRLGVHMEGAALHAHTGFFCHMCAFAWTDITPTLAAITLPKGPFKPHEIPVTPAEEPGSPPQRGEGMGAPFGLSVPVEAQVAL